MEDDHLSKEEDFTLDMEPENQTAPSDLRIVLLGSQTYAARSTASLILGREELKPGKGIAHSKCTSGQISGRNVVLVETPAWYRAYKPCDTTRVTKAEIMLSVSHCPPGPHAFILVVQADMPFTEASRWSVEEHMNLLGERVWDHTLVLFGYTGCLKDKNIDRHIAKGGKALQWLVEKCKHRFTDFKSDGHFSDDEAAELMKGIDKMLEGNGGSHFEMDSGLLGQLISERKAIKTKVAERRQRRMDEQNKRNISKGKPVNKINIVLLGWVFSKKSIVRNTILSNTGVEEQTLKCVKEQGRVGNQKITVVDTPGWWKFFPAKYTSDSVKAEIRRAVSLCSPHPHAFLLMIPTATAFTEEQRRNTEDNMRLLGEQVWEHTIVVFTDAQWLGQYTIEEHIESEGESLRWLVDKCNQRYFAFDNLTQDQEPEISDLIKLISDMAAAPGQPSFDLSTGFPPPEETPHPVDKETQTDESEDALLKDLLGVLRKNWQWDVQEWRAMMNRIRTRTVRPVLNANRSMGHIITFSTTKSSPGEEIQPQDSLEEEEFETEGLSLPQLMDYSLKTYFRKDKGAFDMLAALDRTNELKPEWKQLFEREWSRREVRLTEDVKNTLMSFLSAGQDCSGSEPGDAEYTASRQKVISWIKHHREEPVSPGDSGFCSPTESRGHAEVEND